MLEYHCVELKDEESVVQATSEFATIAKIFEQNLAHDCSLALAWMPTAIQEARIRLLEVLLDE